MVLRFALIYNKKKISSNPLQQFGRGLQHGKLYVSWNFDRQASV